MITDQDLNRAVREWLEDGPVVFPDHALDEVVGQLPRTRQHHRRLLGWRTEPMNPLVKLGVAAAAVVVVVVGAGFLLQPGPNIGVIGTPAPSVSPTVSPSPSVTAAPSASPEPTPIPAGRLTGLAESDLAAGRWTMTEQFPVGVSFTLGDAWILVSPGTTVDGMAVARDAPDPEHIVVFTVTDPVDVYADPCNPTGGMVDPQPGATVEDLVAALAAAPNLEVVEDPAEASVGGYPAVALEVRTLGECPSFSLWPTVAGDRSLLAGETAKAWIVDVEGTRVVVDYSWFPGTDPAALTELESIVASVELEAAVP